MAITIPPRPRLLLVARWIATLLIVAAVMVAFRASIEHAHVALLFVLIVLVGTAEGGRNLGFGLAGTAFLLFNWFFVPPYGTLSVAKPLDWLVLGAFLVTSVVAAQLLARARAQADEAERRADEVNRLSALGAETLSVGRAEEALVAIATVVRTTLRVAECDIFMRPESGDTMVSVGSPGSGVADRSSSTLRLVEWVASHDAAAVQRSDGGIRVAWDAEDDGAASPADVDVDRARVVMLPLRVRGGAVGVMRLAHSEIIEFDDAQWRFLHALSHYAALAVERVRLTAVAERSEALREADRLKDGLLASVSHDLRTPLTTIKALAHDLRVLGDERVETIELEADRLNRMVADLLDLSRLNAGSLALRTELNAADDLVGVALQQTSGILGGREIQVDLDATAPVLFGRFDLVHSVRVLVNLIHNACKYSPAVAPIALGVRRDGPWLVFSVSDEGPGVSVAERERIFAPFYRPEGVPSDSGGAGLGLAIARGLAEAQGGTLTFEVRAGSGSTFAFRVPAAELSEGTAKSL